MTLSRRWRHEQDLEKENISLDFALDQGRRVRPDACVPLMLGRTIEDWAVEFAGAMGARKWLQQVAAGRERVVGGAATGGGDGLGDSHLGVSDLGSVDGYRRVVAGAEVRDECEEQLGPGAWHWFLEQLVDRRMEATPWLNRDFREPLYLLGARNNIGGTQH